MIAFEKGLILFLILSASRIISIVLVLNGPETFKFMGTL